MQDILGHFGRLFQFAGREKIGSFWPFAGVVLGLMMVAGLALFVPEMNRSMARMQQFAAEHPEEVTVSQSPGHYEIRIEGNHPELMPNLDYLLGAMAAFALVTVVLLAAAVARRLHDTGRTGAWGLLPLPFLTFGISMMGEVIQAEVPDIGLFLLLFANNAVYIGSLVLLVVLLTRPGQAGDNRFGPPPA